MTRSMGMIRERFIILFLFLFSFVTVQSAPPPQVVVSLKPLHSWVCALMEGRGTPALLLEGKLSPHTAALRPRDVRLIKQADLMIWIGPSFEVVLEKAVRSLPPKSVLTLETFSQLDWLPQRDNACQGHEGHAHTHSYLDGHIWLDPVRAQKIVLLLVEILGKIDPEARELYEKNGLCLRDTLQNLHQQLCERLTPLQGKPFVVMHDAYQYFQKRYGLSYQGVILLSPERPPSGKHLQEIKRRLQATQHACVFSEPQLQHSAVMLFLKKLLDVREGILDPLGADLPEGPAFYEQLMNQLAAGLEACLR